jgi:hypothetical protein
VDGQNDDMHSAVTVEKYKMVLNIHAASVVSTLLSLSTFTSLQIKEKLCVKYQGQCISNVVHV